MNDSPQNSPAETEAAAAGEMGSSSSSTTTAPAPGPDTSELESTIAAHAATIETQAATLGEHESRFAELEAELERTKERVEEFLTSILERLEGKAGPAEDGTTPASLAANEDGLQPGHAGLGTGDGPAGLR